MACARETVSNGTECKQLCALRAHLRAMDGNGLHAKKASYNYTGMWVCLLVCTLPPCAATAMRAWVSSLAQPCYHALLLKPGFIPSCGGSSISLSSHSRVSLYYPVRQHTRRRLLGNTTPPTHHPILTTPFSLSRYYYAIMIALFVMRVCKPD